MPADDLEKGVPVASARPGPLGVVLAGRWSWLVTGSWWALLMGGMGWLATDPPVRWVALPIAALVALALARVAVVPQTLTLEAGELVKRAGRATVRVRLDAIDTIALVLVPRSHWDLQVSSPRASIEIPPWPQALVVCRELGRQLAYRRDQIRLGEGAAGWLGWDLLPTHEGIQARRYRRERVDVLIDSERPGAACRAVLDALDGAAIQAIVGTRSIAREDDESWQAFVAAAPWPEQVTVRGIGTDPLAVVEVGAPKIHARLTADEQDLLGQCLPTGARLVRVPPTHGTRARRATRGFLRLLAGLPATKR